jgi:hypothetical protein
MPLIDLFLEALARRECLFDFWCGLSDEIGQSTPDRFFIDVQTRQNLADDEFV